jgi:diguanylate cyclase (GGDEF)-like protein
MPLRYWWLLPAALGVLLATASCGTQPLASAAQSLAVSWAFQPGDNPDWAQPGFDDRGWTRLRVPGSWRRQGFDQVTGLAWYRLNLASQWPRDEVLGLTLGKIDSAYEVYVGGHKLGGVGGLPPASRMEYDRHRTYLIPSQLRNADGSVDLALRVWRHPDKISTAAGPVEGPFAIGPLAQLIEQDKLGDARELALVFVFFTVAVYHLALRFRLGQGDEYLWFGILALLAAVYGFLRTQWKYLVIDDFLLLKRIEHIVLWLIPPAIAQFVWIFYAERRPRWLLAVQGLVLAGAVVVAVSPGILTALAILPLVQLSMVPLIAGTFILTVRRLRARDREVPLVGLGMAILSVTIIHDALVDQNYLVDARIANYGFAFLVVVMSVTLGNRFQRALRERDALTRDLEARVEQRTHELNEAYRQMEELASVDTLTRVLNRRMISERAQAELSRARRQQTPFALAMVDVDRFKAINDTSGHAAGDVVLRQVAERLGATVRTTDDVGRWGGEEFLVLLPGAAPREALGAGERLREQVASAPIALPDGSTRAVTISVGVVSVDGSNPAQLDLERLVEAADRALYQAKAGGRNTVRAAS